MYGFWLVWLCVSVCLGNVGGFKGRERDGIIESGKRGKELKG